MGLHRLYSSSCRATGGDQPRWVLRVIYGPLQRIVGYLLPSVLPHRVVRTSRELLVVCNALDVAVVLGVRLVDRWRHQVVFSTRYEQQGRAVFVPEVHVGVLVSGREVGQHRVPHEAARRGDVVALVGLVGLLPRESVGEGVVELLFGEPDSLVAVCGVPQYGEEGSYLCDRGYPDALGRRGVYNHPRRPVTVV